MTSFVFVLLGVEVTTWAGKAVMRRHPGGAKPPPPVRRSSSVTASMNGSADARTQSQRSSKPPVLSPKPKLTSPGSADSRVTSRTSTSSVTSENFPTPPPASHHDDEGNRDTVRLYQCVVLLCIWFLCSFGPFSLELP